jgi:uncharacterized protein (UPF0548 family)
MSQRSLARPSREAIERFLDGQRDQPFTYSDPGLTRNGQVPPGFVVDHHRREIGKGRDTFEAACAAARRWEMFRLGWVEICWPDAPIVPGTAVGVLARIGPVWWLNACRIVYVLDEPRQFGFAYGTLPAHAEKGEERFSIDWNEDGSVWYSIYAVSHPAHWLVSLGYPLARRLQKRFGADSLAAMERAAYPH